MCRCDKAIGSHCSSEALWVCVYPLRLESGLWPRLHQAAQDCAAWMVSGLWEKVMRIFSPRLKTPRGHTLEERLDTLLARGGGVCEGIVKFSWMKGLNACKTSTPEAEAGG